LDSGAEGIILPQAKSASEIQAFVSACRYPPQGDRGFGPRRPSNYGRIRGDDYLKHANEQLFVAAQIETVSALEELDRIVNIEGLDSLVIGPYDLSGSLGLLGQVHHPHVLDAIGKIVKHGRAAGLSIGMGMGADPDHALEAKKLGVQWAQCGNDYEYMIRTVDEIFASVRNSL
jgi:2-dehydro-3-deoxyglucarate aldolase/4-hydroxy-2-oxoheptanedioate aldolase